jgi:hypothetical protein
MHELAFISGSSFHSFMSSSLDYLKQSRGVMFGNKRIELSLYSASSCVFSAGPHMLC